MTLEVGKPRLSWLRLLGLPEAILQRYKGPGLCPGNVEARIASRRDPSLAIPKKRASVDVIFFSNKLKNMVNFFSS